MPDDRNVERRGFERQRVPLDGGGFDECAFARREPFGGGGQICPRVGRKCPAGQAGLDRELCDEPRIAASEHQESITQLDASHRDGKGLTL